MKKIKDIPQGCSYYSSPDSFYVEGGIIIYSWLNNNGQPILCISTCQENGQILTTDYYTFA